MTLHLHYRKHQIVGTLELRGATQPQIWLMKYDGWKRNGNCWTFSVRTRRHPGREPLTAREIVSVLWQRAMVYQITHWIAGDEHVRTLAHLELAALLGGHHGDLQRPEVVFPGPALSTLDLQKSA
ncbi:MAG: hypothetical protein JWQ08_2028 [Deinococcus sp.]|nr:hypothetical protein [Deinococcus sp.]